MKYTAKYTGYCITGYIGFMLVTLPIQAQFTITDDFRGSGSSDVVIGDDAKFTSGDEDPVNQGWLRLTPARNNSQGYAYINKTFPSDLGVLVDFEYKAWRGQSDGIYNGADGFCVFLFDGTVDESNFQLGGYGGSLGYAPKSSTGVSQGLSGGYIGVGIDEYGNFANPADGPKNGGPGFRPQSIVLRGPTTANPGTTNQYLEGVTLRDNQVLDITTEVGVNTQNEVDYNSIVSARPDHNTFYRRVQIEIVPATGGMYDIIVRWKKDIMQNFIPLISYTTSDPPPALLKLGFAASTGGGFNNHEIRNILVTTPGNLRAQKLTDKDIMRSVPGSGNENQISYTLEVTNDTPTALTAIDVQDFLTDAHDNPIPVGMFEITDISHSDFTTANLPSPTPASPITSGSFSGTVGLAANSTGFITVAGVLNQVPEGNMLRNIVTVGNNEITDEDLENNTATVNTPVIAEQVDLMLMSETDDKCIDYENGNNFELTVVNMGTLNAEYRRTGTASQYNHQRIVVEKVVPPGYTYDDSQTSYTTNSHHNASGNPPWYRIEDTDTPAPGYTTYTYVARGPGRGEQVLNGGGAVYGDNEDHYFVKYNIIPPSGTLSHTDEARVEYRAANGSTAYDGSNIEEPANLGNNTTGITLAGQPDPPGITSPVYFCLRETAVPLTATADPGNTLRWYTDPDGVPLSNAPVPNTADTGSTIYYVSQTNGNCESELSEIEVTVKRCRVLTNPMLPSVSNEIRLKS